MTYMHDGTQYIAVMAGTGASGRGAPVVNNSPKLLVFAVPD
jgi:hypothetical protein